VCAKLKKIKMLWYI